MAREAALQNAKCDYACVNLEPAPARETVIGGNYRHTLHVEHPVEAVRAAGWPAVGRQLTVAHHDLVLMLHFRLPVYVDVLPDELPHLRPSEPLEENLWLIILQTILTVKTVKTGSSITMSVLQLSV